MRGMSQGQERSEGGRERRDLPYASGIDRGSTGDRTTCCSSFTRRNAGLAYVCVALLAGREAGRVSINSGAYRCAAS